MTRLKKKEIWLIFYTFLSIFNPPILPIPFIYVNGIITVGLILHRYGGRISLNIVLMSKMKSMIKFISIMFIYLIAVSFIDILFITSIDFNANRLRCLNQLVILSSIQFLNIWYIFILADDLNYDLKDIFIIVIKAGTIQGICGLISYYVPIIRELFVIFGDNVLYNNAYVWERRAYGFSMTLLDTFGYGMGLIAGYILLLQWNNKIKYRFISLMLVIFSIIFNSRTGIIIFTIAIVLKLFQIENKKKFIIRLFIIVPIALAILFYGIPIIFDLGQRSENVTIRWVVGDLEKFYRLLFDNQASNYTITNVNFLSNFVNLPANVFELIFGSGHSVYDTTRQLGFRTDNGYINTLWIYGILGTLFIYCKYLSFLIKPFRMTKNNEYKLISIFNTISYCAVLLKAILIGYNPGVFITYLTTFAIYYYTGNMKRQHIVIVQKS